MAQYKTVISSKCTTVNKAIDLAISQNTVYIRDPGDIISRVSSLHAPV